MTDGRLSSDPILAIIGPTASGKSDFGLRLAKEQNAEIISVDSRQVYRYLSIGTAKPKGSWIDSLSPSFPAGTGGGPTTPFQQTTPLMDPPEGSCEKIECPTIFNPGLKRVPSMIAPGLHIAGDSNLIHSKLLTAAHDEVYMVEGILTHLVDLLDPANVFSVADFVPLALAAIEKIRSRGKKPIFVGGTGLYFKALTDGLAALPPADPALRDALRKRADSQGRPALHRELALVDTEAAQKIPANNIARVIRALEVFRLTGKPISAWHREHQDTPKTGLRLKYVGIERSLEESEARIAKRCAQMLTEGMIEETQNLLDKKYAEECPALTGLGYPRVVSFLKKEITKDELLTLLIRDTRRYAKRQRTWFRHQMTVEWVASDAPRIPGNP